MTTRRDFIRTAVAVTVGTSTLGQSGQTRAETASTGPKQLPRGLTLLSIAKAGGAETLGVKLPSGIL
ncbi:MAG: twin-arginine translocation signal domain-containing protein, partial [Bradyrhizobium sp.]|nr:twin-arginine translocation signal domain-containing protein [Bradyrhizobium sp.]